VGQPKINAIVHSPVGESVYRALRDLLVRHHFTPGQKLNVEALSRALGVSRTPVWEALKRLEVEGVVRTQPRKGVYLHALDADKAREIFVVRETVEGLAARLAARHVTAVELRALERSLDVQKEAARAGEVARYSEADLEFHDRIVEASRNQTLIRILRSLYGQILVLRLQALQLRGRIWPSILEHHRIFAALKSGDPSRAEAAARRHVRKVVHDVVSVLSGRGPTERPRGAAVGVRRRRPPGA
jgi:DNA-binding GntR family transcriptional regulator